MIKNENRDVFDPWLAAGIVTLMGYQGGSPLTVSKLNDYCKGQNPYVQHWSGGGAKNKNRLFSFASAIQAHVMAIASNAGVAPRAAREAASASLNYYNARFVYEQEYEARSHLIGFINDEGRVRSLIVPEVSLVGFPDAGDASKYLQDNGERPPRLGWYVIEIGRLLCVLTDNYRDVDEHMNQLALEGRLKPFPEQLK